MWQCPFTFIVILTNILKYFLIWCLNNDTLIDFKSIITIKYSKKTITLKNLIVNYVDWIIYLTFPPLIQKYTTKNTKFFLELGIFDPTKCFREDIQYMVFWRIIYWFDGILCDESPNVMILYVNVPCFGMENYIFWKFYGWFVLDE